MPVDTAPTRLVDQLKGGLDAPICLTWEITYGCNLACIHCLSSSGRRDPRELSTTEAMAVIDELHDLQVFYVNIGGGEPTIRPDFYQLVDYSVERGVGVKFSTNGSTITPERARRLSGTDYVDVQISIDGADAATNDAVRGEGSYRAARRAMDHLAAADFGPFKISVVVTRENAGQLDDFESLAAGYGAQLRLTRLRPSGRGAESWHRLHPTQEQQIALYRWLIDRPGVLTGDSFFHLSALGEPLPGLNLCGAGRVVCLIDPIGDVYACPFVLHPEFRAGSVRDTGGFTAGVAPLRSVRRPAPAHVGRRVRLMRVLRQLSGRMHGGQVLHRAAPRRTRSRVRQGTRRGAARSGSGRDGAVGRARPFGSCAATHPGGSEPHSVSNLADLAWPDVASRASATLLALPVGATEQHGPHLPLATDTEIAVTLAHRLARWRPDVVVAPALAYGSSGEHAGFPGTLSVGAEVVELTLVELIRSADAFAGVIIISTHGGNAQPVHRAVQRLTAEGRRVQLWWPSSGDPTDAHAGFTETSVLLATRPELVHSGRAEPGVQRPIEELLPVLREHGLAGVSPNGVLGDPTGASAPAGERVLAEWTRQLVDILAGWP